MNAIHNKEDESLETIWVYAKETKIKKLNLENKINLVQHGFTMTNDLEIYSSET